MVVSKAIGLVSILAVSSLCCLAPRPASAVQVQFTGIVDLILVAESSSTYAPLFSLGTSVGGIIDDPGGEGSIGPIAAGSATQTSIPFTCCIFAGLNEGAADIGLELTNDEALDADTAAVLNALFGSGSFATGQLVDIVDLEGDGAFGSGRFEAGLSFLFDPGAFGPGSTPRILDDAASALGGLFFVSESDTNEEEIFNAVGALTSFGPVDTIAPTPTPAPIPTPSSIALMLSALAAGGALRLKRTSHTA